MTIESACLYVTMAFVFFGPTACAAAMCFAVWRLAAKMLVLERGEETKLYAIYDSQWGLMKESIAESEDSAWGRACDDRSRAEECGWRCHRIGIVKGLQMWSNEDRETTQ